MEASRRWGPRQRLMQVNGRIPRLYIQASNANEAPIEQRVSPAWTDYRPGLTSINPNYTVGLPRCRQRRPESKSFSPQLTNKFGSTAPHVHKYLHPRSRSLRESLRPRTTATKGLNAALPQQCTNIGRLIDHLARMQGGKLCTLSRGMNECSINITD